MWCCPRSFNISSRKYYRESQKCFKNKLKSKKRRKLFKNNHEAKNNAFYSSCSVTPIYVVLSIVCTAALLDIIWELDGGVWSVLCVSAWTRRHGTLYFDFQSGILTTLFMKIYITYIHTFKYNNDILNLLNLVHVSMKLTFWRVVKS